MSLDVYLETSEVMAENCACKGVCPCHLKVETLFDGNVTHNLGGMAEAAGLYDCCWRPDENEITKAHQLIEPLREGLAKLKKDPQRFKRLNPPNGWGDYDVFVKFIEKYLAACEENPMADVRASR